MNPQSLILVTVDCLRADHVGWLGYKRPTTPFLDSLAQESAVFSNAIVAGAPTYYSFPAVMASRAPLALGRDVIGLAPGEVTLASTLRESGYATAAFLAGNPYLSRRFGYSEGFDTFHDFLGANLHDVEPVPIADSTAALGHLNSWLDRTSHKLGPIGRAYDELYFQYCQRVAKLPPASFDSLRRFRAADTIVGQASEWITKNSGKPFFLWVHFMDPHGPYYPCQQVLEWLGRGDLDAPRARYLNSYWNRHDLSESRLRRHLGDVVALYDAGIRWVDFQLSQLIENLRQSGVWDRCSLAVTADHGEEFLDHGRRYHSPSQVGEEIIRVPLLLRSPGMKPSAPMTAPFSLLHLAPTLLDAVDVPIPGSFHGHSHWAQLRAGKSWKESAVVECVSNCTNPFRRTNRLGSRVLVIREQRYKLVIDFFTREDKLYDLENDPRELKTLPVNADKSVRKRLLEVAHRHISSSRKSRDLDLALAARFRDIRVEAAGSTRAVPA